MKILITGGLGFIGSNLAKRLAQEGHEIVVIDSLIPQYGGNMHNIKGFESLITVNISDIRDPYATRTLIKDADIIFNLAGQTSHADSMHDPFSDLEINAKAQLSLLEAVREVCPESRVVFASTRQIYGRPDYLPVDEKHPIRPVDVNGVNKVAGENYHVLYNNVYGIKTSCLRLTNTYGPGMRIKDARQTFVGIWLRNALEGKTIEVYGDGLQLRDFNYVDDVVEALIKASEQDSCLGKCINLGGTEVLSLVDLAELICAECPKASWKLVPFPEERRAIDIGDYYASCEQAKSLLCWEPKVSMKEGLAKTLEYYEAEIGNYL